MLSKGPDRGFKIEKMAKFIDFLKEVKIELGKVSWPSRKQTTTYTLVVIGLSLFLAVFLGALDLGFQSIINNLISR